MTADIFHCLLGFDTSYARQIGVLAFAREQNDSPSLQVALTLAPILCPLLAPRQRGVIWANLAKGQDLVKQPGFLLGYRFEDHSDEPTAQVHRRYRLAATC